tara:strand:- start:43 stop:276 length:234 start_codon:yes stop_codon:yes gene_type:complete
MKWKLKKHDRVLVEWVDIVVDVHTEDEIEPCQAETVGWIDSLTKKYIRVITSRYLDTCDLADKIVIPMGCVNNVTKI